MSTMYSHNLLTVSVIKPYVSMLEAICIAGIYPHFRVAVALIHKNKVVFYTFGDAVVR